MLKFLGFYKNVLKDIKKIFNFCFYNMTLGRTTGALGPSESQNKVPLTQVHNKKVSILTFTIQPV